MKQILEWTIRRRNPQFRFAHTLKTSDLAGLAITYTIHFLRGVLKGRLHLYASPGASISGNVKTGRGVKLGQHSKLSAPGASSLVIGDGCNIGSFSQVIVTTNYQDISGHIRIGARVGIGEFAYLGGTGGLLIGDDCIVGQYFSCHPENHTYHHADMLIRQQGVNRQGIRIGANCWIGSKVTILDGVSIGSGCVIAAGAVVTRSFPPNQVIGGVPAKILKT